MSDPRAKFEKMAEDLSPDEVTAKIIISLRDLGMSDCYMVVPSVGLVDDTILNFWQALDDADTLKYRWADDPDMTPEDILKRVRDRKGSYYVIDSATAELVGEFTLDNFTGKAAQIHFAMHPENPTSLNQFLADKIGNMVLTNWVEVENMESSYVETLIGLTPMPNRAACIFVLKAGFKKLGTLPSGSFYLGNIVDSMISIRNVEDEHYATISNIT